jgi:predicted DNA-binding transcriptional regulator AlpA
MPEPPVNSILLLSADQAAQLLSIGRSLFWSMHSSGKTPLPVKLGRRTLWRRRELEAWVEAGCPGREHWQQIRGNRTND